ncbi:hypothetical protein C8Q75DRAFT_750125 [Abortiporus biennis]|nr:hypothetical protein C8Q75DRAFT_750125 [Abortiporus biennis]
MQELTLKHFILKQRVLDYYRHAIRVTRGIPDSQARRETVLWIRSEIERNRYIHDVGMIEDKLAAGRRELKQILPSITLTSKPI